MNIVEAFEFTILGIACAWFAMELYANYRGWK